MKQARPRSPLDTEHRLQLLLEMEGISMSLDLLECLVNAMGGV